MSGKNCFNRTMGVLLFLIVRVHEFGAAQSPISFFPHHVGDLWQYRYRGGGELAWTERIDSMFVDTSGIKFVRSKRLYHDINPYSMIGWYGILDSVRIFEAQVPPNSLVKLLYKLDAQMGEVWLVDSAGPMIAQFIDSGSTQVFGRNVAYKDIRYGYLSSSLDTMWWDTRRLATGFGLIYADLEPMGPVALAGAIIDSVRWGFIVNVTQPIETPRGFSLEPNFPNPFNAGTTIRYHLPTAGFVVLKVYDLLGREISTLVNSYQLAGEHRVFFTPDNIPSGVYYYRLKFASGGQIQTRKFTYVK